MEDFLTGLVRLAVGGAMIWASTNGYAWVPAAASILVLLGLAILVTVTQGEF